MNCKVIISSKETGEKLKNKEEIKFSKNPINNPTIKINEEKEYQKIIGFGGAFTEAGAYVLSKLEKEKRKEAISAYFNSETGINYTFCRTHINSCDFSLSNYSYDDVENDVELKEFSIQHDKKLLIPLIKDAIKISEKELKIFASPWSPPAWMKTNGRMNNGGKLKKEYYEIWARYFAKYIKEYKKEGINIWGITLQNEPMAETPWDNCIYSNEEERDFLKVIGPILKEEEISSKIIVWDHNKDIMKSRVDTIFSDKEAIKWAWGVGFHWYSDEDSKTIMNNSVLDYIHEKYETNLVFTEGCIPYYNMEKENLIGEWWTGEKYGTHIIEDLNHWTRAWCDWNMFLNEKGGPNHVNNYCDAPIMADGEKNKLYFNSSYYYMGHFSKYIMPGAVRIDFENKDDNLQMTAFKNENGDIILVVMNKTDKNKMFSVELKGEFLEYNIDSHSIITFIIDR